MLKTKALKKIFITTLTMFTILTIYTIPTTNKSQNELRTNLEISDITSLPTNKVYLLNKNNYLVKVDIFLDGKTEEEKIKKIIDYLIVDNDKNPINLNGYLPKNTKVLKIDIKDNNLYIDFSKDFLNYDKEIEEKLITGLTYSVLEFSDISSFSFTVDNNYLKGYSDKLTKNIGINNDYLLTSRNNINRVVVYYLDNNENTSYFVPVTKYLNDNREKIEIIIDQLKNSNNNLTSIINDNLKLLDYYEEANVLFLNFNNYLLDNNSEITTKTLQTIAYSVFDNYDDINMVMFKVNNEQKEYFKR